MKNLSYLATRIFNTPLMISQDKAEIILSVLGPRMNLDVSPSAIVDVSVPKRYRSVDDSLDGIGVIPIYGTLVHRTLGVDATSELVSYTQINSLFGEAINDSSIKSILLDIDSPGGEVSGLFGLVDTIYQARSIKPIYAMVNESAYSAAYAIASAAEAVFIPPTGGAGSIGVIMIHLDQSKFDEKIGAKYSIIYSGERKKDFTSHEPLSKDVLAIGQGIVDDLRTVFVDSVARNRGLSAQVVRGTEAGSYQGQAAVDIGLADEVMSYSQLIENITKSNRKGGKSMSWFDKKKAVAAQVQAAQAQADVQTEEDLTPEQVYAQGYKEGMEAGKARAMAAAKAESQEAIQAGTQTATQVGVDRERARCTAIQEQVSAISHLVVTSAASNTLLNSLIKSGATTEMAGQQIIGILAGQQQNSAVFSTVSATSDGEVNKLIVDANRRAAAAKGSVN